MSQTNFTFEGDAEGVEEHADERIGNAKGMSRSSMPSSSSPRASFSNASAINFISFLFQVAHQLVHALLLTKTRPSV